MRIDGITTCVGPLYAGYLAKTLPVWQDTLDSLTIIFDSLETAYQVPVQTGWSAPVKLVVSNAFTRNGSRFNKAAALNEGIAAAQPTDWILAFDCDIIPPPDWRTTIEPLLEPGNLYYAPRYQLGGKPTDRRPYPRGCFQLWHTSDAQAFPDHYTDAGGYDTEFANRWPQERWQKLPIRLTHLGERSRYWCGPETTPAQQREALKRCRERRVASRR